MEDKLRDIFNFLKKNRHYNRDLQTKCYVADVTPYKTTEDKILSLLYRVINTQSQSDIDQSAEFFINIQNNRVCLKSMQNFLNHIGKNEYKKEKEKNKKTNLDGKKEFNLLFLRMKDQPGWGPKTAALFVKSIFHVHSEKYNENTNLKIWPKMYQKIEDGDVFRLPVDKVILEIFKAIKPTYTKTMNNNRSKEVQWSFTNINKLLSEYYPDPNDIEIWDDLWFWGFITQRIHEVDSNGKKIIKKISKNKSKKKRFIEWNPNKYWALRDSGKKKSTVNAIERKAEVFIDILKSK